MRGTVSVEYALLLLAAVGLFTVMLGFYIDQGLYLQGDVRKLLRARYELLRLRSAGDFVSSGVEGGVSITVSLLGGITIKTVPLSAEVNVDLSYAGCGDLCVVTIPGSFTEYSELSGRRAVSVYKVGGEVGVR